MGRESASTAAAIMKMQSFKKRPDAAPPVAAQSKGGASITPAPRLASTPAALPARRFTEESDSSTARAASKARSLSIELGTMDEEEMEEEKSGSNSTCTNLVHQAPSSPGSPSAPLHQAKPLPFDARSFALSLSPFAVYQAFAALKQSSDAPHVVQDLFVEAELVTQSRGYIEDPSNFETELGKRGAVRKLADAARTHYHQVEQGLQGDEQPRMPPVEPFRVEPADRVDFQSYIWKEGATWLPCSPSAKSTSLDSFGIQVPESEDSILGALATIINEEATFVLALNPCMRAEALNALVATTQPFLAKGRMIILTSASELDFRGYERATSWQQTVEQAGKGGFRVVFTENLKDNGCVHLKIFLMVTKSGQVIVVNLSGNLTRNGIAADLPFASSAELRKLCPRSMEAISISRKPCWEDGTGEGWEVMSVVDRALEYLRGSDKLRFCTPALPASRQKGEINYSATLQAEVFAGVQYELNQEASKKSAQARQTNMRRRQLASSSVVEDEAKDVNLLDRDADPVDDSDAGLSIEKELETFHYIESKSTTVKHLFASYGKTLRSTDDKASSVATKEESLKRKGAFDNARALLAELKIGNADPQDASSVSIAAAPSASTSKLETATTGLGAPGLAPSKQKTISSLVPKAPAAKAKAKALKSTALNSKTPKEIAPTTSTSKSVTLRSARKPASSDSPSTGELEADDTLSCPVEECRRNNLPLANRKEWAQHMLSMHDELLTDSYRESLPAEDERAIASMLKQMERCPHASDKSCKRSGYYTIADLGRHVFEMHAHLMDGATYSTALSKQIKSLQKNPALNCPFSTFSQCNKPFREAKAFLRHICVYHREEVDTVEWAPAIKTALPAELKKNRKTKEWEKALLESRVRDAKQAELAEDAKGETLAGGRDEEHAGDVEMGEASEDSGARGGGVGCKEDVEKRDVEGAIDEEDM